MLYKIHFRRMGTQGNSYIAVSCIGCNADMLDSGIQYIQFILGELQGVRRALLKELK